MAGSGKRVVDHATGEVYQIDDQKAVR